MRSLLSSENAFQGDKIMFYVKNLPGWERALRLGGGGMMIAGGLYWMPGSPMGYVAIAMGVMAGVTGLIGFCPMCAMVGRKLDKSKG